MTNYFSAYNAGLLTFPVQHKTQFTILPKPAIKKISPKQYEESIMFCAESRGALSISEIPINKSLLEITSEDINYDKAKILCIDLLDIYNET